MAVCEECEREFEAPPTGRPPRFCSGACRTRFSRKRVQERERIDSLVGTHVPKVVIENEDLQDVLVVETHRRVPLISLDDYLEAELAITRAQIKNGALRDPDGKRMRRSERYLRWRYSQFEQGLVGSL